MNEKKIYSLIDAAASVIASVHYQMKQARLINPNFERTDQTPSPSSKLYVSYDLEDGRQHKSLPAIAHYAKFTLDPSIPIDQLHCDVCVVPVTQNHREEARELMKLITNKVLIDVLTGVQTNTFTLAVHAQVAKVNITERDIGLLSHIYNVGSNYRNIAKLDEKKAKFSNSKSLGHVKDKIKVKVTIFNKVIMQQYQSILYEGADDDGNLISFFKTIQSADHYEVDHSYMIKCRIKSIGQHKHSNGAIVNTMNYVIQMSHNLEKDKEYEE